MSITIREKLENLAAGASADLLGWGGVHITPEDFLKLVYADQAALTYFTEEVGYPGAYNEPCTGLDTCVRDEAMDVVARATTGRDWPMNLESESAVAEFRSNLEQFLTLEK
jgi:hypothetical protein